MDPGTVESRCQAGPQLATLSCTLPCSAYIALARFGRQEGLGSEVAESHTSPSTASHQASILGLSASSKQKCTVATSQPRWIGVLEV